MYALTKVWSAGGQNFKSILKKGEDMGKLSLKMFRLAAADDRFSAFGLNPKNSNTLMATNFTEDGFTAYLVLPFAEAERFCKSSCLYGRAQIPDDFRFMTGFFTTGELMLYYGCRGETIRKWSQKTGKTPVIGTNGQGNKGRRKQIPEDFAEMYKTFQTNRDLAEHYHVSPTTINVWAHETGMRLGRRHPEYYLPDDYESIARQMNGDLAKISAYYDVSVGVVMRWQQKVDASYRNRKPVPDDFSDVCRKYSMKKDVAEHYGVSYTTLTIWLAEAGIQLGKRGRHALEIPSDFEEMAKFMTPAELIVEYRVSASTITRWLKKIS